MCVNGFFPLNRKVSLKARDVRSANIKAAVFCCLAFEWKCGLELSTKMLFEVESFRR